MTPSAIAAKHWILRHYVWVALGLLVLALVAGLGFHATTVQQWLSIVGVPALFVVTIQKQKNEELGLFKQLFTEFNRRYDELNEKLNGIRGQPDSKEIEQDELNTLFDYFNLCGEEYLYFSQGYIYPEVWRAWRKGMAIFRDCPRIRRVWDEELRTGSYYGLNFDDERSYQSATPVSCRECVVADGA